MKTHWKKLHNPNYLGAHDLMTGEGNAEQNAIIQSVGREDVVGSDGKKEQCTVARLHGMKPMILNVTNSKAIEKITGSPFIEDWQNAEVCIYVTQVKAFGEMVDALRIKRPKAKPVLKKGTAEWNKAIDYVKSGKPAENIAKKYQVDVELLKKEANV